MKPDYSVYGMALSVFDLDRSVEWYTEVLGFTLVRRTRFESVNSDLAFLECKGIHLELIKGAESIWIDALFAEPPDHLKPIGNKALVMQVDDIKRASQDLEDRGVTIVWRERVMDENGTLNTMFRDPDRNLVSIFQR
ncbi:hypothetical protein CY652_19870 [Burkholderia sp. WAC0059]|uniref:VOC family protein n=1 Tax=Burkholderia sp. WAC0059 TaxID=2066022 RepID=UPI000C7EC3AF|nr:VOC family protein [Burkholderia sp. WAC0059]PLZ00716.1 hypothetical protein CY652_19870 [Burkholderia sp. WAC0059]